ncbi:MAG: hypothetical protein CBD18_03060 [Opitutales bacterium TMED158]|nr:MAG: hypothetical protein CBD18_03060 [Opitutales bacterium TMED158]
MGKRKRRVEVEGNTTPLGSNPFGDLNLADLPETSPKTPPSVQPTHSKPNKSRGRVDVIRQRAAGGGGWMTVAKNFVGISQEEKADLRKRIQKRCGVGGALKDGRIEIQGDKRDEVKATLEAAGFRVVFAGG